SIVRAPDVLQQPHPRGSPERKCEGLLTPFILAGPVAGLHSRRDPARESVPETWVVTTLPCMPLPLPGSRLRDIRVRRRWAADGPAPGSKPWWSRQDRQGASEPGHGVERAACTGGTRDRQTRCAGV